MSIEHTNITDPFIHEPKGIASASANEVYVSDGAGSGSWNPVAGNVLNSHFTDISSAGSIYIPVVQPGNVAYVAVSLHGAITVANSIVTVYNTAGASMGTITVTQAGSAAGSTFTLTPVSNTAVTAGSSIRVESDGGSSTAVRADVSILVRPT